MYNKPSNFKVLLTFLSLTICLSSFSQAPDFSKVPNLYPGDTTSILQLIHNGIKVKHGNVVAWFPKDSMSAIQMNKIIDTMDFGIKAAETLIKAPRAWQAHKEGDPYTFYFRKDSFVSHASGAGFVSIPFWRIKERKAPWLHEVLHEILNSKKGNWMNPSVSREESAKNMPLWLVEGLPEYISIAVSQRNQLPHFDVHTNADLINIDSICKEDFKNVKADYILSFIGNRGMMPELFGKDRRLYAPAFYHYSCSFVKYLVEQVGIEPLITSLSAYPNEHEELEKRLASTIEERKRSWITKISGR